MGNAYETDAKIHAWLGRPCPRCGKPSTRAIGNFAYCSDECEERIGDYDLDFAAETQHVYGTFSGMEVLLDGLRERGFRTVLTDDNGRCGAEVWCPDEEGTKFSEGFIPGKLPLALSAAVLKLIDTAKGLPQVQEP